jgi:hypothetical protein
MDRPSSLQGQALLRGFAVLLSVLPLAIWFLWFMIPVDPSFPWEKMSALWFVYPAELLFIGIGSWMYWWSFYETPDRIELPIHAQFFRMYVVGFVGITTVYLFLTATQFLLRKR